MPPTAQEGQCRLGDGQSHIAHEHRRPAPLDLRPPPDNYAFRANHHVAMNTGTGESIMMIPSPMLAPPPVFITPST